MIGQRFGRLKIDGVDREARYGKQIIILVCRCDCGKEKRVPVYSVLNGDTSSCGCLYKEIWADLGVHHGEACDGKRTPEYRAWMAMISRCTNRNHEHWKDYGGRGITVCDKWLQSYPAFVADIGRRPSSKHSLDRIENDGNYEPNNVHWATKKEQQNNRRNSKREIAA